MSANEEEQMIHTIGAVHLAMRKKPRDPKEQKPVEVAIKKRRRAPAPEATPRKDASATGARA
jgi:hypothetical protein